MSNHNHHHHHDQNNHLGAAETLAFVSDQIKAPASILDVGCGDGTLAKYLMDCGYQVKAIDGNSDAINDARAKGVDAEEVKFFDFKQNMLFDAVLFSRSLHHILPLDRAVQHTSEILKPGGLLLLEEFGAELVDFDTALWFYGLKSILQASGKTVQNRGPKLTDGEIPSDPVQHWRDHHFGKHGIAESGEVMAAILSCFQMKVEIRVPYLYRYFIDDVSQKEAEQIQKWETVLCNSGKIPPIGIRAAAIKK